MRRRAPVGPAAPERLCRFVPSEWPGDVAAAYEAWAQARLDWHREHIGHGRIGPLGDIVDVIRGNRAVRRQMPPRPSTH